MGALKKTLVNGGLGVYAALTVYALSILVCWPLNLYQLIVCDFEPISKNEIVHLIGLIPLASPITVWL